MANSSSKPVAVPPHAPPANPNWPSRTGNPSGGNRGNAAPNSGSGISPADNVSNMHNANKGTNGVNRQYSQVHGNRGAQLNPNQMGKSGKK